MRSRPLQPSGPGLRPTCDGQCHGSLLRACSKDGLYRGWHGQRLTACCRACHPPKIAQSVSESLDQPWHVYPEAAVGSFLLSPPPPPPPPPSCVSEKSTFQPVTPSAKVAASIHGMVLNRPSLLCKRNKHTNPLIVFPSCNCPLLTTVSE